MALPDDLPELHRRLDEFERRIHDRAKQLETQEVLPPEQQKTIDEMRNRVEALRERMNETRPSSWVTMKNEIESEWKILTHTFESWANHVDKGYRPGQ